MKTKQTTWILIGAAVVALVITGKKSMNPDLLKLLKKFEGFRASTYKDPAGHLTIGYGHKLVPPEAFPPTITEAEAERILIADIARTEKAVLPLIKVPVNANEKAALLSFAFNLGAGALKGSTLLAMLNAGNRAGAAAEFARWNKARNVKTGALEVLPGLVTRRAAEQALFLTA